MIQPPIASPAVPRRTLLLTLIGATLGALLTLGAAATRTGHLPEAPPGPEVTLAVTPLAWHFLITFVWAFGVGSLVILLSSPPIVVQ